MWNTFLLNPLFGEEINGGRLGFGENSWLAIAATTGLLGLIPMLNFGLASLSILRNLSSARFNLEERQQAAVVNAGLSSLLVGSIFEAYLLGTLCAPILFTMLYATIGNALLTFARQRAIVGRI